MACFLVPTAEAIIVMAVRKIAERKQNESYSVTTVNAEAELDKKDSLLYQTRWLTNLLWGGSVLLAFEHIWHGEIAPWFPFLTAMRDPDSASEMFREMATNGVGMAAAVTLVWIGMTTVSHIWKKKSIQEAQ